MLFIFFLLWESNKFGWVLRDLISLKAFGCRCIFMFNTKDGFHVINVAFTSSFKLAIKYPSIIVNL